MRFLGLKRGKIFSLLLMLLLLILILLLLLLLLLFLLLLLLAAAAAAVDSAAAKKCPNSVLLEIESWTVVLLDLLPLLDWPESGEDECVPAKGPSDGAVAGVVEVGAVGVHGQGDGLQLKQKWERTNTIIMKSH